MAELNYKPDFDDANESSFDPIPAGDYIAVIEDSDLCDTKAGDGQYLKLVYQIVDGEYKGKKIFENLNLSNPNKQAEAISRRSLNAICAAVDVQNIDDSIELHNKPLVISVVIKDTDRGKQNSIRKHMALDKADAQEEPKKKSTGGKKHAWEKYT